MTDNVHPSRAEIHEGGEGLDGGPCNSTRALPQDFPTKDFPTNNPLETIISLSTVLVVSLLTALAIWLLAPAVWADDIPVSGCVRIDALTTADYQPIHCDNTWKVVKQADHCLAQMESAMRAVAPYLSFYHRNGEIYASVFKAAPVEALELWQDAKGCWRQP